MGNALSHPGGNLGLNLESISHRCHPILVAFAWQVTKETINLPLECLQGGTHVPNVLMNLPPAVKNIEVCGVIRCLNAASIL